MLLSAGETLDGLGLAETTPGPLILVTCSWVSSPASLRARSCSPPPQGSLAVGTE